MTNKWWKSLKWTLHANSPNSSGSETWKDNAHLHSFQLVRFIPRSPTEWLLDERPWPTEQPFRSHLVIQRESSHCNWRHFKNVPQDSYPPAWSARPPILVEEHGNHLQAWFLCKDRADILVTNLHLLWCRSLWEKLLIKQKVCIPKLLNYWRTISTWVTFVIQFALYS